MSEESTLELQYAAALTQTRTMLVQPVYDHAALAIVQAATRWRKGLTPNAREAASQLTQLPTTQADFLAWVEQHPHTAAYTGIHAHPDDTDGLRSLLAYDALVDKFWLSWATQTPRFADRATAVAVTMGALRGEFRTVAHEALGHGHKQVREALTQSPVPLTADEQVALFVGAMTERVERLMDRLIIPSLNA